MLPTLPFHFVDSLVSPIVTMAASQDLGVAWEGGYLVASMNRATERAGGGKAFMCKARPKFSI